MVTDSQTNFVYFSSLLASESRYAPFWNRLQPILEEENIPYGFLEGTKDIWCRDYMPVQVNRADFTQFLYKPDYCSAAEWLHKLTIPGEVRYDLDVKPALSEIIVDGGNIVNSTDKVIMTDKIYRDNPEIQPQELQAMLQHQLQTGNISLIPRQPYDMTGHSDGMVRFLDSNTLLVSDYQGESDSWKRKYEKALEATGLEVVIFPSVLLKEKNEFGDYTARGCYINYAQIGNKVLLPFFDLEEDEKALKELQRLLPDHKILPIAANEIAQDGGVLNCITWTIKR